MENGTLFISSFWEFFFFCLMRGGIWNFTKVGLFSNRDGAIEIFIPGREFIFCTCEVGGVWHLIPRKNKSYLRLLLRAHGNWQIMLGDNLGQD